LSVLGYFTKLGVACGIVLLNLGVIINLLGEINGSSGAGRVSNELMRSSMILLAIALLLRFW